MSRVSMSYIIRLLRGRVNDSIPIALASSEYYAGDTIKLQNTYKNLSDVATDPDVPTITITSPNGTVVVDAATPTQSATGIYFYNFAPTAIEGYWKVEFGGSISSEATIWPDTFRVFLTEKFTWTDDELQIFLDMNRKSIRREQLSPAGDRLEYASRFQLLEGTFVNEDEAGAIWDDDRSIIKLWDSSSDGSAITPDSWNLADGIVGFDTEQTAPIYMDARRYNLHGAIAMCFEQLAADPTRAKQWTRGGVSYTFSDFQEMAQYHRNFSGAQVTRVVRVYR